MSLRWFQHIAPTGIFQDCTGNTDCMCLQRFLCTALTNSSLHHTQHKYCRHQEMIHCTLSGIGFPHTCYIRCRFQPMFRHILRGIGFPHTCYIRCRFQLMFRRIQIGTGRQDMWCCYMLHMNQSLLQYIQKCSLGGCMQCSTVWMSECCNEWLFFLLSCCNEPSFDMSLRIHKSIPEVKRIDNRCCVLHGRRTNHYLSNHHSPGSFHYKKLEKWHHSKSRDRKTNYLLHQTL